MLPLNSQSEISPNSLKSRRVCSDTSTMKSLGARLQEILSFFSLTIGCLLLSSCSFNMTQTELLKSASDLGSSSGGNLNDPIITGLPPKASSGNTYSNSTSLNLTISAPGFSFYEYKIGPTISTDCSNSVGYSSYSDISNPIIESLIAIPDVEINFCLLVFQNTTDPKNYSLAKRFNWIKDTQRPSFTLDNLIDGGMITISNQANYTLSGTCSDNNRNVVMSGAFSDSIACNNGVWSKNYDFTSLSSGPRSLELNYSDSAGNLANPKITFTLNKSTSSITGSISITGTANSMVTKETGVSLLLTSNGTDMCVTADSTCQSGCVWNTFATNHSFTLTPNSYNGIYVSFRTGTDVSSCIGTGITQDSMTPTMTINSPAVGATLGQSTQFSQVAVNGTCSEDSVIAISGTVTATANCSNHTWSTTIDLSSKVNGSYSLDFTAEDPAGNRSSAIPVSFSIDRLAP